MAVPSQRRAGIITFQVNGEVYDAKGSFTVNFGRPKREPIIGSDAVHGYKETPQPPMIEGAITDRGNLDIAALVTMTDVIVTLAEANGKTFILRNAWYAGDGNLSTDEAQIDVKFIGASGEEVSA